MSLPCRLCGSPYMPTVLDLGEMAYTGIFPSHPVMPVPSGRLAVALCSACGLAQLADEPDLATMYGPTYGYRSGLNQSMVQHLKRTALRLNQMAPVNGSVVLDIGSNDGTLLGYFQRFGADCIGIDPTSAKWAEHIPDGVLTVERFFDADTFWAVSDRPATVVTSIAMFYDLPDPVGFARDVERVLEPEGLWHLEVAYMPAMLRSGAFDTVCHEHVEYYSLTTLDRILRAAGFKIISATTNGTNGGSIAITAAKMGSAWAADTTFVPWMLATERRDGVCGEDAWVDFAARVKRHHMDLLGLLSALKVQHKATIKGLGASTKGNVLLQATGIGTMLVDAIGDVNPDKHGKVTPGTHIPIVDEPDVLDADYLLVLPWHFREGFMQRMDSYLSRGGRLIFPLPDIEIVGY